MLQYMVTHGVLDMKFPTEIEFAEMSDAQATFYLTNLQIYARDMLKIVQKRISILDSLRTDTTLAQTFIDEVDTDYRKKFVEVYDNPPNPDDLPSSVPIPLLGDKNAGTY